MRAVKSAFLSVLALAVFAAPAVAQETTRAEMMIKSSEWSAAFNRGDADALARLYAQDAVLMAPGAEPVEGRDGIRGALAEFIEAGLQLQLEIKDVMSDGYLAVVTGKFVMTSAEGDHVDHGPYVEVWWSKDGQWHMHKDIFNSSMAPPQ
jgi:uncharacterized protein (TIGR02246 family)